MKQNITISINETSNLVSHVLAHLPHGNLSSIYNPQYIQKIQDLKENKNNLNFSQINIKNKQNQTIQINWDKFYQALTFLPLYFPLPINSFIEKIKNLEFLYTYFLNWELDTSKKEIAILSKVFSFIIEHEYKSFYKNYWKNQHSVFNNNGQKFINTYKNLLVLIIKFLEKLNPSKKMDTIKIICIESYGMRGKSLSNQGAAIGLADSTLSRNNYFAILLHELIHNFSDPLVSELNYQIKAAASNNENHLRLESVVNYILNQILKNIIQINTNNSFPYDTTLVPKQIKNKTDETIQDYIKLRNNSIKNIHSLSINNNNSYRKIPRSQSNQFKIIPEIKQIGTYGKFKLIYSPLISKTYLVPANFFAFINAGILTKEESTLLQKEHILIPQNITQESLQPKLINQEKKSYLRIHITEDCSLRCVYCYLEGGTKKGFADINTIEKVIDKFIDINTNPVTINFHGGGEPLMNPSFIKKIMEKISKKVKHPKWTVQSNGVISEKTIQFLIENNFEIGISIDGPPHIHNAHRPGANNKNTAVITEKTIRSLLTHYKEKLLTISVITKYTVTKQKEILSYLYKLGVKRVVFDPLSELGRTFSSQVSDKIDKAMISAPNLDTFIHHYLEAMELATEYKMVLSTDFIRTAFLSGNQIERNCNACDAAINLTTDNYLTACTRGFSIAPPDTNVFVFGKYNTDTKNFEINKPKQAALANRSVYMLPECENCILKYSCAGDCMLELFNKTGTLNTPVKERCNAKLKFTENFLKYQLELEKIKEYPKFIKKEDADYYQFFFNSFKLSAPLSSKSFIQKQTSDINPHLVLFFGDKTNATNYSKHIPKFINNKVKIKAETDNTLTSIFDAIVKHNHRLIDTPNIYLFSIIFPDQIWNAKNVSEEIDSVGVILGNFMKKLNEEKIFFKISNPLPSILWGNNHNKICDYFKIPLEFN